MGSDNFEQDLGELSGQLKALMPTLERMEARLHQAQIDAAAAEARNQALRKEFDDLKTKVSNRLADLYKKAQDAVLENGKIKNQNGNLKRDIKEAVNNAVQPLLTRVTDLETKLTAIEEKKKSIWNKAWEVAKILMAAGVGAVVTKLLK
jgi:chromosome segregation ATPase